MRQKLLISKFNLTSLVMQRRTIKSSLRDVTVISPELKIQAPRTFTQPPPSIA
jgi:hypothetical protein